MTQTFKVIKSAIKIAAGAVVPDCQSDPSRQEAAILHTITDLVYEQYIKYHFGANPRVENTIIRGLIINIINTPLPSGLLPDYIEFSWDQNTNVITPIGKAGTPAPGTNDVDYSVCLFKGIDLLDNMPDAYIFVKAKDRDAKHTVVFKTIKGGNIKHYYDVSDSQP